MNNNNNYYYDNDSITKNGIMKSFTQSQEIKPNELVNDNPLLKSRDSFDKENSLIKNLNDDIYKLNTRINTLLIENNKVEKLKLENE